MYEKSPTGSPFAAPAHDLVEANERLRLGNEERARAQQALRDSEARFRTLVQNLRDYAIFMLSPDRVITQWSDGAEQVTGYTADEVIGCRLDMFYPPELLAAGEPKNELDEAAATGRAEREGWRLTRSGERIWINEIATALYDTQGRLTGFTKISRDLTARKRAEDALREADRRKDEFLATLAHELRNPLAPLRSGLQIVKLSSPSSGPVQSTVSMMNRQLTHLVRLVDDLLDVARIRSGKIELRRAIVSLREVVRASCEATRPLLEGREHRLQIEAGPVELCVEGDFDRLTQVVSNLLSNAAKYTEPGGLIRVALRRSDRTALVCVTDSGIGIPADELPKLFDMFSQVGGHEGRAQGGLGIGLSLVRSLLDMHGGSISAHSNGSGAGSEFIVKLPLCSTDAQPKSDLAPAAAKERRHRILVVDDNVDAAESLSILLTMQGHEVLTAHDGLEALDQVPRFRPDVVMMDLGMPRLDGLEAARRMRALREGRDVRLIALTGWGQETDRERSREAGFDTHLVKPIDPGALEALLGERQAQ